ncbi:MAG: hypothetical protein COC01_05845 [Bacteroidetes bacterium]|nr:Ig-like domain-containing protein [Bacteroidia bacterium]PCH67444.1 MAG: hypothetical protein COC01_05845 [Bacteroidota bacterium]
MKEIGYIIFLILFLSITFSSCYKEKDPTCAEVLVQDKNANPIINARVRLHQDNFQTTSGDIDTSLYFTGYTESDGKVTRCYELEAIWEIEATYDGKTEDGFIKLIANKTTTETITIK